MVTTDGISLESLKADLRICGILEEIEYYSRSEQWNPDSVYIQYINLIDHIEFILLPSKGNPYAPDPAPFISCPQKKADIKLKGLRYGLALEIAEHLYIEAAPENKIPYDLKNIYPTYTLDVSLNHSQNITLEPSLK
ncbi:MAG: hypothetical protein ACSHX0_13255 [Akkermansiaceae bacterium]